jgi:hypothetical protein
MRATKVKSIPSEYLLIPKGHEEEQEGKLRGARKFSF